MLKVISVLFFILFLSNIAMGGNNISEVNGHDWNSWGIIYKNSFVTGFISSANYFQSEITMVGPAMYNQTNTDNVNKVFGKYPQEGKTARFTKDELTIIEMSNKSDCYLDRNNRARDLAIYNLTNGQITEGLNLLYQDFKNQNIFVNDAIYVIKRQIEGYSQEDIEKILLYLRSGKNNIDALIVRDKEDIFIRYIQFP